MFDPRRVLRAGTDFSAVPPPLLLEMIFDRCAPPLRSAASGVRVDADTRLGLISGLEFLQRRLSAWQCRLIAEDTGELPGGRSGLRQECGVEATAAEVGALLALSPRQASARVEAAVMLLQDSPGVWGLVEAGRTDLYRAQLAEGLLRRDVEAGSQQWQDLQDALVEELPGLTSGQVRVRVRQLVERADPGAAGRRHARAVKDRSVQAYPLPDGMGAVYATLGAEDAMVIDEVLDALADACRDHAAAEGHPDQRGHQQRRADALAAIFTAINDQTPIPVIPTNPDDTATNADTDTDTDTATDADADADAEAQSEGAESERQAAHSEPDATTGQAETAEGQAEAGAADGGAADGVQDTAEATDGAQDTAEAEAEAEAVRRERDREWFGGSLLPASAFTGPDSDQAEPGSPRSGGTSSGSTRSACASSGGTRSGSASSGGTCSGGRAGRVLGWWLPAPLPTQHGRRPHLIITLSAATLAGLDDLPADLAGHGAIGALQARAIAAQADRRSVIILPNGPHPAQAPPPTSPTAAPPATVSPATPPTAPSTGPQATSAAAASPSTSPAARSAAAPSAATAPPQGDAPGSSTEGERQECAHGHGSAHGDRSAHGQESARGQGSARGWESAYRQLPLIGSLLSPGVSAGSACPGEVWAFTGPDGHRPGDAAESCRWGELRYRPSRRLADQVAALLPSCRFPGCPRRAHRCDLDHVHPHGQGGPTCLCNLIPLCRKHHRGKTFGGWQVRFTRPEEEYPAGTVRWVSPRGQRYHVPPPPLPGSNAWTPTQPRHAAPADDTPADPDPPNDSHSDSGGRDGGHQDSGDQVSLGELLFSPTEASKELRDALRLWNWDGRRGPIPGRPSTRQPLNGQALNGQALNGQALNQQAGPDLSSDQPDTTAKNPVTRHPPQFDDGDPPF